MRKQQKAAEAKKLETERLQGFLQEMLKEEENKYCADCEAKQPRWASWNLGVFLCIRCAGLHRNLGVHISKVKSVTLDSWTPEQVQSMRVMGNAKARAVYECDLPTVFRRPQTDQSLEAFIRSKYEAKRYLMKDWSPPRIDIADLPPHPSNIHDKKGAILEKAKIGGHKGNSKLHSSSDPDTLTGKENQNDKVQNSAVQLIDFSTSPIKQQGQVVNSTALIGVDLFAPVETTTADQQQTTVVGEATVDDIFGPIVSANASSNHLPSTHPTMTVSSPNLIFEQPKGSFATAFDNGMVPTETPAQSQQSTALSSDLLGLDLDRLCSISGVEVAQPNNTHQASAMLRTSHSVSTGLDASLFTTEPASVDTKKSTKEILDLFNKR